MNSSKTVLDASLLEAMFYTIQYSTVLYCTIEFNMFFSMLQGGVVLLFRFNFRMSLDPP